jgi:hypothetical protein
VLAHARALLTSGPEGTVHDVDADVREPGKILREAGRWLDRGQPAALMLMSVLGHIADYGEARSMVTRLLDGLPAGIHLAINDGVDPGEKAEAAPSTSCRGRWAQEVTRPEQFARFFGALNRAAVAPRRMCRRGCPG